MGTPTSRTGNHQAWRMLRKIVAAMVLFAGFALTGTADAKKNKVSEGVEITVRVLDIANDPIPTAVVRHPDEADRHRVNSMNGEWNGTRLYMPDGSELVFTPGMTLRLEVSAPGYMTQIIQYDIRKRKNNIQVQLEMLELEEDSIEEPMIQFGRDKPID